MKNKLFVTLSILGVALFFSSCKKDNLTQEDLDNSLKNIEHPSNEFKDWRLIINQTYFGTSNWKDTLSGSSIDFPKYSSYPNACEVENTNFKYYWGENKYSIYIDIDTMLLTGLTKSSIETNTSSYPYLSEMYLSNKYLDKFDIISVSDSSLIVYSNSLERTLKYTR